MKTRISLASLASKSSGFSLSLRLLSSSLWSFLPPLLLSLLSTAANMDEVLLVDDLQIVSLTQGLAASGALDALEVVGIVAPDQPLSLDVFATHLTLVPVQLVVAIHTQRLVVPKKRG